MPAAASVVQIAYWCIALLCSDHTEKFAAYIGNCACKLLTTSWSSKNKIVPAPALNISNFCAVVSNLSTGMIFCNSLRVISHNLSCCSPNKITTRVDCELKSDGVCCTACSTICDTSCALTGNSLFSA